MLAETEATPCRMAGKITSVATLGIVHLLAMTDSDDFDHQF